jgi:hypothetical protein
MNPRRGVVLGLLLVALAACATPSSSGGSSGSRSSGSPRVRCLSDPARDDASGSRPLIYLFCLESP